jgi:RNA polymerase sigma factor (TIGR02999 family)
MNARPQVTQRIAGLHDGGGAWDRLLPVVYYELRRIAHRQLRQQRCGHTLNRAALVPEAYFKLVHQTRVAYAEWAHFFGVVARAMRQVLIDYARRRAAARRGGGWRRIPFDETEISVEDRAEILLALDGSPMGKPCRPRRCRRARERARAAPHRRAAW